MHSKSSRGCTARQEALWFTRCIVTQVGQCGWDVEAIGFTVHNEEAEKDRWTLQTAKLLKVTRLNLLREPGVCPVVPVGSPEKRVF
ncbi:hypothetical protein MRX96_026365 [Rhipicephalus microplus]